MPPDPAPSPPGSALASPTGRRPLAVLAWACAVLAPFLLGVGVVLGILGMVLGSGAHLKGDRWGMPAAVVSGITCIVAMALVFFLRPVG